MSNHSNLCAQLEAEAENEARNMDPNKVKLRFEVFERGDNGQLIPVCENEVYSDTIQNMSKCFGIVRLLCTFEDQRMD